MKNKIIEILEKPSNDFPGHINYKAMDINFIYVGYLENKCNDLIKKMSETIFKDDKKYWEFSAQHKIIVEMWGELLKEFSIHKKDEVKNQIKKDEATDKNNIENI